MNDELNGRILFKQSIDKARRLYFTRVSNLVQEFLVTIDTGRLHQSTVMFGDFILRPSVVIRLNVKPIRTSRAKVH